MAILLVVSTLAACTTTSARPPKPALGLAQYDACRLVAITEVADLLRVQSVQPRRTMNPDAAATCTFGGSDGTSRGGIDVTVSVAAKAALERLPDPGASPVPRAGDGARVASSGDTTTAQVWLGGIGVTVKVKPEYGNGSGQPPVPADPARFRPVLTAAAKRLADRGSRLTASGDEVDFGNPACALLSTSDVDGYFRATPHHPASGGLVDHSYTCQWLADVEPAPGVLRTQVFVELEPGSRDFSAFEQHRPVESARFSGVGDVAFINRGTASHTLHVLYGTTEFTVSAQDPSVAPPRPYKAHDDLLRGLGLRAVGRLPKPAATHSPPPALQPTAPSGEGLWCCADNSASTGARPAPTGATTLTGDGFTLTVDPNPFGNNEWADRGLLYVKLFDDDPLDGILTVDYGGNSKIKDPAQLLATPENVVLIPDRTNYQRIALKPLTYRGGLAVDWEGSYGGGGRVRMHFANRVVILPDGRQLTIHVNGREENFNRLMPYLQAALATFDPTIDQ